MSKKSKEEKLAYLFARDKNVHTYHLTSDGQAFTEKHRAENHASSLEDGEVSTWKRREFEAFQAAKDKDKVETTEVETPKVETPKVEITEVDTTKVETPKVETPASEKAAGQETASKQPAKSTKGKTTKTTK